MYRKFWILIGAIGVLAACDKHDPILPGVRTAIFAGDNLRILNESVPNAPDEIFTAANDCQYTQKDDNTIWSGEKKIFSGFATNNYVTATRQPVCDGGFVYAGLTTGELVKINPRSRELIWTADIYRPTNMTGGAATVDIVAPAVIRQDYVYAGGIGNAFCKISAKTGAKAWCLDIGVDRPFLVTDNVAYVVDTDKNLNAIRTKDGAVYWRVAVVKSADPKCESGAILVGSERFSAETGKRY